MRASDLQPTRGFEDMSDHLREIGRALYEVCHRVETDVVGHPEGLATYWARCNSARHAHTARALMQLCAARGARRLRVLNASGLSCGHQDFAISKYLREQGVSTEWLALESPRSPYLDRRAFADLVSENCISIRTVDFTDAAAFSSVPHDFDAVLFTELAEHLDHSALLRSFLELRHRLSEEGRMIVTTPNLLAFGNRIKFILGRGDAPYWGDGQENRKAGLYGHVVNYDRRRLCRLLLDSGLVPVTSYCFDYLSERPAWHAKSIVRSLVSWLVPDVRETVFVVARRGPAVPIPFQI